MAVSRYIPFSLLRPSPSWTYSQGGVLSLRSALCAPAPGKYTSRSGKSWILFRVRWRVLNGRILWTVSANSIRDQINRGFEKRQDYKIREAFHKWSVYNVVTSSCFERDGFGRHRQVRPQDFAPFIPKSNLRESLGSLDVSLHSEEEVETLFFVMDLDDNKGLDVDEFRRALQASSHRIICSIDSDVVIW